MNETSFMLPAAYLRENNYQWSRRASRPQWTPDKTRQRGVREYGPGIWGKSDV